MATDCGRFRPLTARRAQPRAHDDSLTSTTLTRSRRFEPAGAYRGLRGRTRCETDSRRVDTDLFGYGAVGWHGYRAIGEDGCPAIGEHGCLAYRKRGRRVVAGTDPGREQPAG